MTLPARCKFTRLAIKKLKKHTTTWVEVTYAEYVSWSASWRLLALYVSFTYILNDLPNSKSAISSWSSLCYSLKRANLNLLKMTNSVSGLNLRKGQPGTLRTCTQFPHCWLKSLARVFVLNANAEFHNWTFYQRVSSHLISKNRYLQPKHMARNNRWAETNRWVNTR